MLSGSSVQLIGCVVVLLQTSLNIHAQPQSFDPVQPVQTTALPSIITTPTEPPRQTTTPMSTGNDHDEMLQHGRLSVNITCNERSDRYILPESDDSLGTGCDTGGLNAIISNGLDELTDVRLYLLINKDCALNNVSAEDLYNTNTILNSINYYTDDVTIQPGEIVNVTSFSDLTLNPNDLAKLETVCAGGIEGASCACNLLSQTQVTQCNTCEPVCATFYMINVTDPTHVSTLWVKNEIILRGHDQCVPPRPAANGDKYGVKVETLNDDPNLSLNNGEIRLNDFFSADHQINLNSFFTSIKLSMILESTGAAASNGLPMRILNDTVLNYTMTALLRKTPHPSDNMDIMDDYSGSGSGQGSVRERRRVNEEVREEEDFGLVVGSDIVIGSFGFSQTMDDGSGLSSFTLDLGSEAVEDISLRFHGENQNVCPSQLCGESLMLVVGFDFLNQMSDYHWFDDDKSDNFKVFHNLTLDCTEDTGGISPQVLEGSQFTKILPNFKERGHEAYVLSCSGLDPPMITSYSSLDDGSWRIECDDADQIMAKVNRAKMYASAFSKDPESINKCNQMMQDEGQCDPLPDNTAQITEMTDVCQTELVSMFMSMHDSEVFNDNNYEGSTIYEYYSGSGMRDDVEGSASNHDMGFDRSGFESAYEACKNVRVVCKFIRQMALMFDEFDQFDLMAGVTAVLGNSTNGECPHEDFIMGMGNTSQFIINFMDFVDMFARNMSDLNDTSTEFSQSFFEEAPEMCYYLLASDLVMGQRALLFSNNMNNGNERERSYDIQHTAAVMSQRRNAGLEIVDDSMDNTLFDDNMMGEDTTRVYNEMDACDMDSEINTQSVLDVSPLFYTVRDGSIYSVRYNPFSQSDASRKFSWKRIARVRCPNCEAEMSDSMMGLDHCSYNERYYHYYMNGDWEESGSGFEYRESGDRTTDDGTSTSGDGNPPPDDGTSTSGDGNPPRDD